MQPIRALLGCIRSLHDCVDNAIPKPYAGVQLHAQTFQTLILEQGYEEPVSVADTPSTTFLLLLSFLYSRSKNSRPTDTVDEDLLAKSYLSSISTSREK